MDPYVESALSIEVDHIYDIFNDLILDGKFDTINGIIGALDVNATASEILLTYLTAMKMIDHMVDYKPLRAKVFQCLSKRYPDRVDSMMHGL